jgi:hypothetical protein
VGETVCAWPRGKRNFSECSYFVCRMLPRDWRVVRSSRSLSILESARLVCSLPSDYLSTRESLLMKGKPKNRLNSISNGDTYEEASQ